MRLTFLGTSGGKPTKERNCSAIALECENEKGWYLFDCAEGTQRQILFTHLSLLGIKAIFITHIHGDHCYGLPGLLTSMMLDNRSTSLTIYASKELKAMVEAFVDLSLEHLGYEIEWIELHAGFKQGFEHFTLTTLPLIHSVESFAFHIETKPKINIDKAKLTADGLPPGPLYAKLKSGEAVEFAGKRYDSKDYLIVSEPTRLIISGDNAEPDILSPYLQNLDLLVHEATYTQDTYDALDKNLLHTTAKTLALSATKHNVKHLIATHLSPRYGDPTPIYEEIARYYHHPFWVANDFDRFTIQDGTIAPS